MYYVNIKNNIVIKKRPAFTFLELLLVLLVVSILAAASSPFFSRFLLQNAVASSSEHIVSTLRKAQEYTIAGKNNSTWQTVLSGNTLTLVQQSGGTVFDTYTMNSNVAVSGLTTVSFTRPLGQVASPVSISITAGTNSRSVSVNTEGVVSY
ncbi:MAG: prepilin-type N-terminal cleavage/methylation domain-containing protein [Candidatus Berkelbacteria bacterium]